MPLTPQEQAELDSLKSQVSSYSVPKNSGGLSPAEQAELAQLKAMTSSSNDVGHQLIPDAAGSGVDNVSIGNYQDTGRKPSSPLEKIDSWFGAPSRAAIDQMQQGNFTDAPSAAWNAFNNDPAKAPSPEKLVDNMGIQNPLVKMVANPVVGAITDPLSYATLGESAIQKALSKSKLGNSELLAKLQAALNPSQELTQDAGKALYKSGFKKIDERLAEAGAKPLSDVAWENGRMTGTTSSLKDQTNQLKDALLSQREKLYTDAATKGARIDPSAITDAADQSISKLKAADPYMDSSRVDAMREYAGRGIQPDPLNPDLQRTFTPSEASSIKTRLRDNVPDKAFGPNGYVSNDFQQLQKDLGNGWQQAIESETSKALPEQAGRVKSLNQDIGSIIEAQDPLKMQVRRANTHNMVSPVDTTMAVLSPHAEIAKKLGDLTKMTGVRTTVGKGIYSAGENGLVDPLIRNMIVNKEESKFRPQSPYILMPPKSN